MKLYALALALLVSTSAYAVNSLRPSSLDFLEEYQPIHYGLVAVASERIGENLFVGQSGDERDVVLVAQKKKRKARAGTSIPEFLKSAPAPGGPPPCYRISCPMFVHVNKRTQRMRIWVNGELYIGGDGGDGRLVVSTAGRGHVTPDYDGPGENRWYDAAYDSKKSPGGDWQGLGNMPFAVFYKDGRAIHGTPSIGKLGQPASHGCIRMNPYEAMVFNGWSYQIAVQTGDYRNIWFMISNSDDIDAPI